MSKFVPFMQSRIDFLLIQCIKDSFLPYINCSIFSDVAGDITIVVDGESFLLHKVSDLFFFFCPHKVFDGISIYDV